MNITSISLTEEQKKRQKYRKSPLRKFRAELVKKRKTGSSYRELQTWLNTQHVVTHHTTIARYLKTLPELQDAELSQI